MGLTQSTLNLNFEDMQTICRNPEQYILINTLPDSEQGCLIKNTIPGSREEAVVNACLKNLGNIKIIIYGRNCNDSMIQKKHAQLTKLGFSHVYVYPGGLFEWLLLQDIYGAENFPTSSRMNDILKFKPNSILNIGMITM